MRKQILALSVFGILGMGIPGLGLPGFVPFAHAGLITSPHEASTPVDSANVTDEASQQAERELGLTRTGRREVQRRLVKLGFVARVNGKFDDATRDAIGHWQEDHGYGKTGYLDATQHKELLSEAAPASETGGAERSTRRHSASRAHRSHGIGGPIGVIGNAVTGIFRR